MVETDILKEIMRHYFALSLENTVKKPICKTIPIYVQFGDFCSCLDENCTTLIPQLVSNVQNHETLFVYKIQFNNLYCKPNCRKKFISKAFHIIVCIVLNVKWYCTSLLYLSCLKTLNIHLLRVMNAYIHVFK